jgi:hypothetical protein
MSFSLAALALGVCMGLELGVWASLAAGAFLWLVLGGVSTLAAASADHVLGAEDILRQAPSDAGTTALLFVCLAAGWGAGAFARSLAGDS